MGAGVLIGWLKGTGKRLVNEDGLEKTRSSENWSCSPLPSPIGHDGLAISAPKMGFHRMSVESQRFVRDCLDCPVGLIPLQQIEWAKDQHHPFVKPPKISADDRWWSALLFEPEFSAKAVDDHRGQVFEYYSELAKDLQGMKAQWLKKVPEPLQKMMRSVHGMVEDMGFEDVTFLDRLQRGFQVIGRLDKSYVGVFPETRNQSTISMSKLWENRQK